MQNYIAALLSNITYLKIEDYALRPDGTLMIFDQAGSGISAAETSLFNEYFTIEYQKNGTEGFSAMKIVAIKTSDFLGIQSGDVTIAFRGTEAESNDWITDIGMGIKAISALTPKIITEGSKYLPGLLGMIRALGDLPVWEEHFKSQSQQALDYFNVQKKLSNNITVVGHSLGGYLANYVTTTGDNYTYINETRTFNAPGFNASRMAMLEVQKEVEKILSTTTNLTEDQINELIHEVNNLSIKIGGTSFNPDSFSKLNPFFAENGPELTSNDIVMFLPESVNKIPMFITPQIVPTNTHGIGLLTESSALYDILNTIMTGSLIDNYKKITKLLESFESHPLTTKTINTISSYISHFFGFSTQNPSAIIQYLDVLTPESLNSYIYNDINHSTYDKSSSSLYALFNFIPFSISNIEDFFKNTTFDIDNYTQKNIDERYNLFEKYQALKTPTVSNATLKDLNIYESYKVIYEENSSSAYIIFDEYNKIILTNDSRSASSSAGIGDFSFYGDSFANIETTYLKNNQSALFVNTLKNKVFDTYSDDYIHLNKGKTTLDLSYGSDTVSIDVAAGATIKDLTIKDDGLGDLFIFNGGSNSDIITGTKYKDKIIGNDGDDHLFSGAGNDTINGGNGNDFIFGEDGDDNLIGDDGDDRIMGGAGSNYLEGGNGDDTLNAYNTLNEYHDIRGDRLSGGSGTNTLFGTGYGDTYIYGGGIDTIRESDKNFGINYVDKLLFSSNIQSSQVGLYNILNNLVIFINGLEKIFIIDYYNNNYSYLDEIHFINPITGYPIIWDTNYILQHTINTADNKVIIGSNNAETISGTEADNYIEGRDGNDIINGGDGNDTIYGGNGNDTIHGNNGDDILYGDAGADNIYGDAGNDVIYGGEGNDFLIGGAGNDLIFGEDGDDNISGDDGNDTIHGGIGNDTLNGGNGNDTIYGGGGVDTIQGGAGADTIYGDDGNDIINGGNVRDEVDTIYGGNGNDIINQGSTYTNDIIIGGKGDDTIYGNVGSDKYHYTIGDGNDTIIEANDGASYIDSLYLHGISPNDVEIIRKGANVTDIYITFKDSSEFITIKGYYKSSSGTNYLDEIIFDNGTVWKKANIIEEAKRYYGTEGNDSIAVQSNGLPQAIYAGGGNDSINNSVQGTFINSGEGGDTITSSNNDVIIDADAGDDTIRVVSGTNITINGGAGSDNIQLTTGKETIIYKVNDGSDTITTTGAGGDIFNISGYNKIDLSNIFLSGQGKTLELRFNAGDSIKLTNYINLLANINNAMTFNFDNGSMSNIELKDLYTIINKAEIADNKFYDTVASDQITGTDGDDNINIINGNGGAGFDVVNSGNGIDTIKNKIDNTVINAGNDNDIIYTYGQNVTINGDAGDDRIYINETSYVGSGYLNGGEGNDTISFQTYTPVSNNYIIEGDLGNDTINMSRGTETIIFKKNDGNDTINISGSNEPSQKDKLIIKGYSKNDITADNFLLFDNGRSVTLKLGLNDSIKLVNFLSGTLASNNLKYFEFDDGTLTSQELIEKITYIKGTNGNDIIYDTVFKDTIDLSGLGDDRVTLKNGNDLLITGNQSTFIEIQSSNNTINSGSGSDYLYINVNSTNTLNLKSSNNGHDSIGFAYLNTNGIIHVNINKTINIADTSVKGNYYKFSWGHDSSLSFTPDALNNRIIFNNQIMNLDDVNLVGDDGDNYLKAISSKGQTIYGNGGVDTIYGSINNDFIYGGLGNDKIYGQDGDDHLYGDDGDDYIGDTAGNNTIYGGNGNDTIYIGKGNDVVYGGNGNDYIESVSGLNGVDFIYGGDGDDTIKGGAYYGEFHGQDGNDTYEIYKGLIVDQSGSNALIFRESNYTASAIRQTSNGFQLFKGDEILVDYIGIVNKIQINSPSPDGYGRYASLVGTEINKLFELQAALTHEIENDNSEQKINELRSQMSYLWRTDTQ